ncbi:hypothetical protein [Methylobacter tundripaludum]|uniref:hypothetical protein n=1 Tax=Methylobacter tundripaludum TaxID=173365 RepID=UPI0004DFB1FB|nr:hypothetical protein [Methylobacter tundripaludum]
MPKYIFESARQRALETAAQYGFAIQLKSNGEDQYVKNLLFYFTPLNQTVYCRNKKVVNPSQKSKLNIATKGLVSINLSGSI